MSLTGSQVICQACGASIEAAAEACPNCHAPQGVEQTRVTKLPVEAPLFGGKWRLGELLGKGGMGAVYLGYDVELDRQVAIKLLADNLSDDAELVQRFEREARMMARLDHPNLVPVYAVGRHGKVPFIVMKKLEGQTLGDLMERRGRFEFDQAMAIARQICAGLQFVHDRDVVHRDIKPANIFVAPDGHVTLLDLGVAREASSSMTRSGVMVGTPLYMSPEQVLAKKVDRRADLYALGVVLYEMLTGQPLFHADSDFSIMRAHVDQAPVNPLQFVQLPQQVVDALLKALAKNPDQRFQSVREFLEALERSSPTLASAVPTQPGVIPRLTTEALAPTAVRGAGAPRPSAVDSPGPRVDGLVARRPSADTMLDHAALRRRPTALWVGLGVVALLAMGGAYVAFSSGKPTGAVDPPAVNADPTSPRPIDVASRDPKPSPPELTPDAKPDQPDPKPVPPIDPKPVPPSDVKPVKPRGRVGTEPKSTPATRKGTVDVVFVSTFGGESSWAYLDIDGLRMGQTPKTLPLEPGTHLVVFQREGFHTSSREITVGPGENRKVSWEMTP